MASLLLRTRRSIQCFVIALGVTSLALAASGCNTSNSSDAGATPTTSPATKATPVAGHPGCFSGRVVVSATSPYPPTPACVQAGSTLILKGGFGGALGTWPGPPSVADESVVKVVTSGKQLDGFFKGTFTALSRGRTKVTVPFVNGAGVCKPTPCTPVPGEPLVFSVHVIK